MNMERRCILLIAPIALALANWLPNQMTASDFGGAQVTQVVQDVKVVPSGAASRPVTVNETVTKGNAVQTGVQSRSELTFKDKTITRLGEKSIFNVGGDGRTIDMAAANFCFTCQRELAAQRSRWVRSRQRLQAQRYWARSIRAGLSNLRCSRDQRAFPWTAWAKLCRSMQVK